MLKQKILIGKSEHEIEVKPVTVVFNAGHQDTVYVDRVSITPDMTLAHFDSLTEIDKYTCCLFKIIVQDYPNPVNIKNIKNSVPAFKHLIGMFSLSIKLMAEGKKIVWKYPEYCLHPKYQGNIAEVMILFMKQSSLSSFVQFVQKGYFDEFVLSIEDEGCTVLKRLDELILTQNDL